MIVKCQNINIRVSFTRLISIESEITFLLFSIFSHAMIWLLLSFSVLRWTADGRLATARDFGPPIVVRFAAAIIVFTLRCMNKLKTSRLLDRHSDSCVSLFMTIYAGNFSIFICLKRVNSTSEYLTGFLYSLANHL